MVGNFKRFIDVQVPIEACTLRCEYCYVTHHRKFNNKLPDFKYDVKTWKEAFKQERWGGPLLVNFCAGGETLIAPVVIDYVRATLEQGHYVMIVTNGTIDSAFDRLAEFPKEYIERVFFKFSYHYKQLIERKLVERFFNNIRKMRDAGASYTLELTPHDELIPFIDDVKALAVRELGAWPHVTVARDEHYMHKLPILTKLSKAEYKNIWSTFDSRLFDFKFSIFNQKRKEFCYAGDWSFVLQMGNGILKQCYCSHFNQNILEDPTSEIQFHPVGHFCKEPHCFNGHSWLGFGDIPTLQTPTFAEMRNRVCVDGGEWLTPLWGGVFATKMYNTNKQLTRVQRIKADANIIFFNIKKVYYKIKRKLSRKS